MTPPCAEDVTVCLIYIKPLEMRAITVMLDERFDNVPVKHGDLNDYTLGRIGHHNVVVVGPARGEQGTIAAARFVGTIHITFPNIAVGLLVGIGGGLPRYPEHDVRLGDVVVGAPETGPAIVQYDLGKRTANGFELEPARALPKPSRLLLKVVDKVQDQACHLQDGEPDVLQRHLDRFLIVPRLKKEYQKPSVPDRLFASSFAHEPSSVCRDHDGQFEQHRDPRDSDHVFIHHSTILSGNTLLKSASDRDVLSNQYPKALCVEMEAAGVMDAFPCLVIRGISDYADSHKNDAWQHYAAAVAAAYAREILLNMSKQLPRSAEVQSQAWRPDEDASEDASLSSGRHYFTGAYNHNNGSQVGFNSGRIVNTFGNRV